MLSSFFSFLCPLLFWDKSLTTLDQWQAASHVLVVEVESFIHFPPFYKPPGHEFTAYRPVPLWKLKVIDTLTAEKPKQNIIYTAFNPLQSLKEKDRVILAVSQFQSAGEMNPVSNVYPSLILLEREIEEKVIYAPPYYDAWPLSKNEQGEYYLPDCVDGLTMETLVNPTLREIKELSQGEIDEESSIYVVFGLYPAEKSDLKVCRCEDKKYNKGS